jgi:hypothetical protein
MLLEAHPQARDHVADEKRGRETVTGRITDREAHEVAGDMNEVAKIPADLLRGERAASDLEAGKNGRVLAKEALLYLGRLAEVALDPLLKEPEAQAGPQDVEGEIHVLADPSPLQEEEQDVPVGPAADRNSRRRLAGQELARPGGRWFLGIGEDVDPVLKHQAQTGAVFGDGVHGGRVSSIACAQLEAVAALCVNEHRGQVEFPPQLLEDFLDECLQPAPLGLLVLEPVEETTEPLGHERGRHRREIVVHACD